jgi:hypothetical protein
MNMKFERMKTNDGVRNLVFHLSIVTMIMFRSGMNGVKGMEFDSECGRWCTEFFNMRMEQTMLYMHMNMALMPLPQLLQHCDGRMPSK